MSGLGIFTLIILIAAANEPLCLNILTLYLPKFAIEYEKSTSPLVRRASFILCGTIGIINSSVSAGVKAG